MRKQHKQEKRKLEDEIEEREEEVLTWKNRAESRKGRLASANRNLVDAVLQTRSMLDMRDREYIEHGRLSDEVDKANAVHYQAWTTEVDALQKELAETKAKLREAEAFRRDN